MTNDFDPGVSERMDKAALDARAELPTLKTAEDVAKWYAKWVGGAGYKRLSRALLAHFGLKFEKMSG